MENHRASAASEAAWAVPETTHAPKASDTAILELAIEQIWRDYQFKDDGSPRPDLSCFPKDFGRKIAVDYAAQIDELIAYGFAPFGLSKQAIQRLREIGVYCGVKDLFLEDVAGLVFAGFGADDRYPSVVTCFVSAIVGGIVKRAEATVDAIDGEVRSKIRVFADSFRMMMHGLVDQVVGAFGNTDSALRDGVRERFQRDFVPRYFAAFHHMIAEYQQHAFINPILRVMEIAGRDELAETARDLVTLNIFKKRIMAQKETVGGAVDVAVISREGGFHWTSRKG